MWHWVCATQSATYGKEESPRLSGMETTHLAKLKIDEHQKSVSRKRRGVRRVLGWAILLMLLALGTAGLLWRFGVLMPPKQVQLAKATAMYPAQPLTKLNARGYVVAQRQAAVSSKATGRLASLKVEEGQAVEAEEIIATLENRDLEAALHEAEAALRVAKARQGNVQAELHDATLAYQRSLRLRRSGAVSEQAHDSTEARYKKALAAERSAGFSVQRAEAARKVAEVNLAYSFIRAPFAGVILTKNADEGEVVAPFGGATNAKAAVVTMADMDSLMVEVDVAESNLRSVSVGQACEIRLDALPEQRFAGRVHMVVPTADRSKATVMTKIAFEQLNEQVLPEMSATVAFLTRPLNADEQGSFLGIPASGLYGSSGGWYVFVVQEQRARRVSVRRGRTWADTVEITEGLGEGDRIVVGKHDGLRDGDRVEAIE